MEESEVAVEGNIIVGDGVRSSVLYIQQELQSLGLPSIVNLDVSNSELSDAKVVVVLQTLLTLYRHNLTVIEEQRDSLTRGKSDMLLQREVQARLKEDIKNGEKELALLEDKERQLNHKVKVLSSKLRAEQDEVRKLKTSMQYKETQRIHENKKKEKEFERLKQKLGQLVSDKSQERRIGMSMPNALQKTGGKRKVWIKPGSGNEDMYHAIIKNYEEKQKDLMLENASLRESLAGMERHLVCVLNVKHQGKSPGAEGSELTDIVSGPNAISSGQYQMPYDIVRDGIEQNFQEKCHLVKKHIDDLKLRIERKTNPGEDFSVSESEVRKLEHKLSDYRQIIGQQEEMLLQKSLNYKEEHSGLLSDSHLWHEQSKLEEERQLFEQQKENFDKERQKFLEAVRQLDMEKHSFEDVMSGFSHDQECLLNSTQELDSFFTKLCSTPSNQSRNLSQTDESTSPSSSLLQNSISMHDVDLKHDLSMCSDDGNCVLNERPID